jgi:chromosome segregation ATPase
MANPFHDARKSIKAVTDPLRGLMQLDELLEKGSDIQKMINEREAMMAKLDHDLETAKRSVHQAEEAAQAVVDRAHEDAAEIIRTAELGKLAAERAKAEAAKLVEEAKQTAADTNARSRADIQALREEGARVQAAAEAEAAKIIATAKTEAGKWDANAAQVRKAVDAARAQVAAEEKRLADLKEEFSKLRSRLG